ncbi:MAG: hypothetical protein PGN15_12760 [Aeromicrobium erythreum]
MTTMVVLGACGSSSDDDTTSSESTTQSSEAPPTTEVPTFEPREDSCKVKGSNATATLTDNADNVVLTFKGESIRPTDTTGFYATVFDAAGENGGQIGAQYMDGDLISYFIAVETDGPQANLQGEPEIRGKTITMTFPKDSGGLGDIEIANWSAAFTVAGEDVGMCPEGYGTQPYAD